MTSHGTIGGKEPVEPICRNCKEWRMGGHCIFWDNYKYALAKACGYFTPKES